MASARSTLIPSRWLMALTSPVYLMRREREIDAQAAALSKEEQANFSFCYYYIAPVPFTQGIFFIFIKFVNSANILCKLRYVNQRN